MPQPQGLVLKTKKHLVNPNDASGPNLVDGLDFLAHELGEPDGGA